MKLFLVLVNTRNKYVFCTCNFIVCLINRTDYTVAQRYACYVLVAKTSSHSFALAHIYSPPLPLSPPPLQQNLPNLLVAKMQLIYTQSIFLNSVPTPDINDPTFPYMGKFLLLSCLQAPGKSYIDHHPPKHVRIILLA